MKRFMSLLFCMLILFCQMARADLTLSGSMKIGNPGNDVLSPVSLLNSSFQPVYPIHFTLTQSTTITKIQLNNGSGASYPISFIVWNSSNQAVIPAKLSSSTSLYSISGSWTLPAGDYTMAVWGQCIETTLLLFKKTEQYQSLCGKSDLLQLLTLSGSEWDDISFSSITLVGATSSSFNFIQRQHIGDSSGDLNRWFPSANSGLSQVYEFTVAERSRIDHINYWRIRDIDTFGVPKTYIRKKGTTTWLSGGYFPAGNYALVYWDPSYIVNAGTYEVVIDTGFAPSSTDADDISWDDVVIKVSPAPAPDHYEFYYADSALTCEPASITLKACYDSAKPCAIAYTADTAVTLTPTSGWSGGNSITITNGSTNLSLSHSVVESITLGLSGQTNYVCYKNGVLDATCKLPFVGSKLSFNIPTQTSGTTSSAVTIRAVEAPNGSQTACKALFSGNKAINFSTGYVSPSSGTVLPKINGTTVQTTATPISLAFDSNGEATFNFSYDDAGVLQMAANYQSNPISVAGSDTVAVIPERIKLSAQNATSCQGASDSDYANCSAYKKVDESFNLLAEAGFWRSGTWYKTANFSTSLMASLPSLQHQLLAPSQGVTPEFKNTQGNTPTLSMTQGVGTIALTEKDVGVYRFGVADFIPYTSYQDESPQKTVPLSLSWSGGVGRFIPVSLEASSRQLGEFSATCSANSMSYIGQSLTYKTVPQINIYGLNGSQSHLNNYRGVFAKIKAVTPITNYLSTSSSNPDQTGSSMLAVTSQWSAGAWADDSDGHPYYQLGASDQHTFTKNALAKVAPFTGKINLQLAGLTDTDSVPLQASLSMQPAGHMMHYGRLSSQSVNGAETDPLQVPFVMQSWDGTQFQINTDDDCTQWSSSMQHYNNLAIGVQSSITLQGGTGGTTQVTLTQSGVVTDGAGSIQFSAPGNGASGWVDISPDNLPVWMQDYWNNSSLSAMPPVRATFGYYRGNDRLIYRRQVFSSQ